MQFSILGVPLERRLQTLCVLIWSLTTPLFAFPFCAFWTCFFIIFFPVIGFLFVVVYYVWSFFIDETPTKGGRPIHWVRNLFIWHYMAKFFPADLVVSHELPPEGNYIFGYHPHGIISVGAFLAFGTEALGISKKMPGISNRLMTLAMNFSLPFYRDYVLSLGVTEVSYKSCVYNLSQGPGRAITIVIGGASEALEAHPGCCDLTLNKRKGFVKVAFHTGASLVPVIGFGENDVYDSVPNPPGSTLRIFQERMLRLFGYSVPLFHGRGIFNYSFGLLPHRRPITVVTGEPIPVPKKLNPTREEINEIHAKYIEKLQELYDKYKDEYWPDRKQDLRIVL